MRFIGKKNWPLPAYGWDQSPQLAQALVFTGVFEKRQKRPSVQFILSSGFPGREILVRRIESNQKQIKVALRGKSGRETAYISFGSFYWLAFLLQPDNFSAAVDLDPIQKLTFLETAILLLAREEDADNPDGLVLYSRPGGRKAKFLQQVAETAASFNFPLTRNVKELRVP